MEISKEKELRDILIKHLRNAGIHVVTDRHEGQSVLNDSGYTAKLQSRIEQLNKVVEFIRNSIKNVKYRKGSLEIQVPEWVNKKAELELKHKIKKHVIDIAGLNHAMNNHGTEGKKIDKTSIPLTKEDIELAPYILISPDKISKGTPLYGRESIIYEKGLSNGKIVYIEAEQGLDGNVLVSKNMWADLSPQLVSSLAVDTRSNERSQAHVRNAIQSIDRAKIIKDAETAIKNEEILARADKFFVFSDKTVYGFVKNDTIYIDTNELNVETPIHEYSHLWAEALRQQNPDEWKNVVSIMKAETGIWNKVKENYPHLETDDEIADEVLATYSGRHGTERLRDECLNYKAGDTIFRHISAAFESFWKDVSNFFGIPYKSADEVADRVFYDLLNEVNPLVYTKQGVQKLSDRIILGHKKVEQAEFIETKENLKQDAKQAIRDRIINPSARSFTSDQIEILKHYPEMTKTPAGEVYLKLLAEVVQEPDVARKPDKWKWDTALELRDLADDITRAQGQGLKR